MLNDMASTSLFADHDPIAVLATDPESNVNNYRKSQQVRHDPLQMRVYTGMRVILTKNLNKAIGFVNGMAATVLGMDYGMWWCAQIRAAASLSTLGLPGTRSCTSLSGWGMPAHCTRSKAPHFHTSPFGWMSPTCLQLGMSLCPGWVTMITGASLGM